ncbi:hypothetical protein [Natrinema salaciae]|uniref:hypothetical protein n=1 Tax=Natrinema salaciae TaxID=1186196 RepID=UPI001FE1E227
MGELEFRRLRVEVEPLRRDRIVIRMKGVELVIGNPLDSTLRGLNLDVIQTNGFGAFPFDIGSQVLDVTDCLNTYNFRILPIDYDSLTRTKLRFAH